MNVPEEFERKFADLFTDALGNENGTQLFEENREALALVLGDFGAMDRTITVSGGGPPGYFMIREERRSQDQERQLVRAHALGPGDELPEHISHLVDLEE